MSTVERLIAFHKGLTIALWRWAWMIDMLTETGDIVALHAALALRDIQPGVTRIETIAEKSSTAGAGR